MTRLIPIDSDKQIEQRDPTQFFRELHEVIIAKNASLEALDADRRRLAGRTGRRVSG
jgi:hypothetical protein